MLETLEDRRLLTGGIHTHKFDDLNVNGVWDRGLMSLQQDGAFELSSLLPQNGGTSGMGLIIPGKSTGDRVAQAVSSAGDINGDGIGDLIVGASGATPGGRVGAGQSYVVFGSNDTSTLDLDLSALDGRRGFVINGVSPGSAAGISVSGAGDFNGDQIDDLLIGSYGDLGSQNGAGQAFVVFGSSEGFPAELDLSSLNGTNGFVVNGIELDDFAGTSVSSAGDVNGDMKDDIIIGARGADPAGKKSAGEAYVVYGHARSSGSFDLSAIDGSNGFVIEGSVGGEFPFSDGDQAGWSVAGAGDFNDDGFDDVILGAPGVDSPARLGFGDNAGAAYILFGGRDIPAKVDVAEIDGTNGVILQGGPSDRAGYSVAGNGDINGDGVDDVAVGAYGPSGRVYVVFGTPSPDATPLALNALNGANGFVAISSGDATSVGTSVGFGGDMNGDGFDELAIGGRAAAQSGQTGAGRSYVIMGQATFGLSLALDTLNGPDGFVVNGLASETSLLEGGTKVSTAGDLNDDGYADLLIGAPLVSAAGIPGTTYLVYGGPDEPGVTGVTFRLTAEDGLTVDAKTTPDGVLWMPVRFDVVQRLTEDVPIGAIQTTPDPPPFVVRNGEARVATWLQKDLLVNPPDGSQGLDADLVIIDPTMIFGNAYNGLIEGFKFEDVDEDGKWQPGEPLLSGVKIQLKWNDPEKGPQLRETFTMTDGRYSFDGLRPGFEYTVTEVRPPGSRQTTPDPGPILLQSGQHVMASEQITLHSGNGTVGGSDSAIRAIVLPTANALTPAHFTAAQSGNAAEIIANISAWKPQLSSDPSAGWIDHSQIFSGAPSVLYAMDFFIASPTIAAAALDFTFLVDNALGNTANEGIFINGIPVPGTKLLGAALSHYQIDQFLPTLDITPFVSPGVNTLYVYQTNLAGPGGSQFSASISVVPDTADANLAFGNIFDGSDGIGNFREGEIHLCKFEDLNGNGRRDPGEPPMAGVPIKLMIDRYNDGYFETTITEITNRDGAVRFTKLGPGIYQVIEDAPAGTIPTTPRLPLIDLQSGQVVYFGDCAPVCVNPPRDPNDPRPRPKPCDFVPTNTPVPIDPPIPDNPCGGDTLPDGSSTSNCRLRTPDDSSVEVSVSFVDLLGQPISTAMVGSEFVVQVYAEDLRLGGEGVYAAYLDMLYDSDIVTLAGPIVHGDGFVAGHSGRDEGLGLLDEAGGFRGLTLPTENRALLFSVTATANATGQAVFRTDPADNLPLHAIVLSDGSDAVPVKNTFFGAGMIDIVAASWQNPANHLDVNNDGFVTPIDALIVVNEIQRRSIRDALGQLPDPSVPGQGPPPYIDPNGDGSVTPLDALLIINRLNELNAAGEGEAAVGEGEGLVVVGAQLLAQIAGSYQDSFDGTIIKSQVAPGFAPTATNYNRVSAAILDGVLDDLTTSHEVAPATHPTPESLGESWDWPDLESILEDLAGDAALASSHS